MPTEKYTIDQKIEALRDYASVSIDTFAEFVADYRKEILTYLNVGNTNMVKTLLEGDTLKPEPKPEPKK